MNTQAQCQKAVRRHTRVETDFHAVTRQKEREGIAISVHCCLINVPVS